MPSSFDIERFPTSDTAQRMLSRVSPVYENSYVVKWLYEVMGIEFDEARKIVQELGDQMFTQTVTWGIAYQEHKYSIEPDESLSLEERRARLYRKKTAGAPVSPRRLEKYIADLWDMTVDLDETYAPGRFLISILKDEKGNLREMLKDLREQAPSHLVWALLYKLDELIEYEYMNMGDELQLTTRLPSYERYPWRGRFFDGSWCFTVPERMDGRFFDGSWLFDGVPTGEEDAITQGRIFDGEWRFDGAQDWRLSRISRKVLFNSLEADAVSIAPQLTLTEEHNVIFRFDGRRFDGSWLFGANAHAQDVELETEAELSLADTERATDAAQIGVELGAAERYPLVNVHRFDGRWKFGRASPFDGAWNLDGTRIFDGLNDAPNIPTPAQMFGGAWTFDGADTFDAPMPAVRLDSDEDAGETVELAQTLAPMQDRVHIDDETDATLELTVIVGRAFGGSWRFDAGNTSYMDGTWRMDGKRPFAIRRARLPTFGGSFMADGRTRFERGGETFEQFRYSA